MNAILVAESLSDKPVPDGWDKSRIHPYALYAALARMKLPHPKYDYTASLEESIAITFEKKARKDGSSVLK